MLLQTNSYLVPKDRRAEHERLVRRIRQAMLRLGCDSFEVYEQVGHNWTPLKRSERHDRFIQLMRFRDRRHHQEVQAAERTDPPAQQLLRDFCALINLPQQQEANSFAIGFYSGVVSSLSPELPPDAFAEPPPAEEAPPADAPPADAPPADVPPSSEGA